MKIRFAQIVNKEGELEVKKNLELQMEFDQLIFNKDDIFITYFGLTNIIYFIAMLFGCMMPLPIAVIIASSQAGIIVLLVLSLIAYTKYDYRWHSVARLLRYYPTKKIHIRWSRYVLLFRYMIMELMITAIPMIFFFYFFDIVSFATILVTVAGTMGVIGTVGIEVSIRSYAG